jgi:VanZ family protein
MSGPAPGPMAHRRARFAPWAGVYALAVIYVSIILGPNGVNFVPGDPGTAWHILLATPYLTTGSDQRPDWMANLLMMVPLGLLVAGGFWPRQGRMRRGLAAAGAFGGCVIFVVAVKYAQLFFPPRTVSLNYVLAQSLGSVIGVALFWLSRDRLSALWGDLAGRGRRALIVACRIYALGFFLFLLFPFDFVLSGDDLRQRGAVLPQLLLSWPGAGLPTGLRLTFILVGTVATIPLGVLLALRRRSRSLLGIATAGLSMMSGVMLASMFLLDATPSLAAIGYRTLGVVIGGILAERLEGQDPARWRNLLARLVPWLVPPYVLAVVFINDLLSPHWRNTPEALAAFDDLGLLPFYHHYIVSKAHAAQSVAKELLCFAPIGVMIALRRGRGRASAWGAAIAALLFSLAIEFGRWFKPGLQPDFSDAIIAAVAAGLAAKLTPVFWHMLEDRPISATTVIAPQDNPDRGYRGKAPKLAPALPRRLGQTHCVTMFARLALAGFCLLAAAVIILNYPLAPWLLGGALLLYGAALWRWPAFWLAVLPAVLPAFDLTPWTGWMDVGEPDLFTLVTIGILALRTPPRRTDFRVTGLPGVTLSLTLISCLLSVGFGLAMPGLPGGSDNPYLRPDNALRLAKGLVTALALLPFLRERLRTHGDAMIWFAYGMSAGLALVAGATMVERALFPGLLDFTSDYRVVATFSSMHIGGGYIGAYIAMALPFLLVFILRPRAVPLLAMCAIGICSGYALIVTFARTAYAAASLSTVVACLAWAWTTRRGGRGTRSSPVVAVILLVSVGAIVSAGATTPYMAQRLQQLVPDLAAREANWKQGVALRDGSLLTALFGTGLGTYPRIVAAHKPDDRFPTNFVVAQEGGYRFLSLTAGSPTYFGQKIAIEPDQQYRLFLALRSPDGKGELDVVLCEKMLLYSANCRGAPFQPRSPGRWEDFGAAISSKGLDQHAVLGRLERPVDLALFDPVRGTTIEVGHIRMFDPQDHDIIANGDFSLGTERWYFADDEHGIWRIFNQYLMSFFEGGVLGLAVLILLVGAALAGAGRAIGRGEHLGAPVLGSLFAFLCSGMFDHLLAVPRLATLFYLIAFCGLTMMQPSLRGQVLAQSEPRNGLIPQGRVNGPFSRAWRERTDRPH